MEWNFGAKVVPTSIEAQYLELPASNYLLSSNESWSIYALTFVAVFYFNCLSEFYNSIYEYLKLYKIVTNKSKLFVYIVVCLLHWNKTVFDEIYLLIPPLDWGFNTQLKIKSLGI